MRCEACGEDVDKSRVVPVSRETADRYPSGTYFRPHHIRYVPGILPSSPDVAETHVGPVICGPLEEA